MTTSAAPDGMRASGAPVVAALNASSLHRFFHSGDEETQALRGVTITVAPGEFVAVVGPSGSGKSTLLSCLAGLDEPDGGTVRIGGTRITRRPESERARLRARLIGLLTQSGNLLNHLSVVQNIALARRLAGNPAAPTGTDPLAELGLAHRAHARPDTLSGGETVRAGLAVALANDPPVLLADEPTGELDSTTEAQVLTILTRRAHRGTALLVASHSAAVAAAADRVITLRNGQVQ
ncbi:ABC transporter ATP-binding protein [Jatrophihabitans lederbergiae]|uniref:ATP-binding cassette domain-containing protein n=1 Tax=Jatrophihabitans lederbergiae TaxID=3075547 RepID=A0ABU2J8Z9_9ACTN|nr:ATP-binding cassette domain-containing protein [Jatrophihabitans sp. DSM 44399]MDT0261464.1 ATP-binding cassette domain-containing protein [Jatrophihabitans sp. DSM 44399]